MRVADPLELAGALTPPERRLDWTAVLDLSLLCLALTLLSSRFITAPGVAVELPRAEGEVVSGTPTLEVLTLKEDSGVIFDGRFLSLSEFEGTLTANLYQPEPGQESVLLVKADAGTRIGDFLRVAEAAQTAGFTQVQLASQPARERGSLSTSNE